MRRLLIILLILPFISVHAIAQDTILVRLSPKSIKVGEISTMQWTAEIPSNVRVVSIPQLPDSFPSGIEVINRSQIDTSSKNNRLSYRQKLEVSAYDSGRFAVPVLKLAYLDANADTQIVLSDSIFLNCSTVPVDTTKAIKDVKDIYEVDYTKPFPWWIVFLVLGLGVLTLIIILIIRNRRKKKPEEEIVETKYIDPAEEALQKLKKMHEERSWTKVNAKHFYTDLTNIIRRYLERQFNIDAEEMVSSEIIDALKKNVFHDDAIQLLSPVLKTADFVKFAKYKPLPGDFEETLSNSIAFVERTKPILREGGNDA